MSTPDPAQMPEGEPTERDSLQNYPGSFSTHRVVRVSPVRIELRAARGHWVFLAVVSTGFAVGVGSWMGRVVGSTWQGFLLAALLESVLVALYAWGLAQRTARRVFDLDAGQCYQGPDHARRELIPLGDLRSFQLLKVSDGADEWHELNAQLTSGKRVPMACYVDRIQATADAGLLAEALGIPVWIQT